MLISGRFWVLKMKPRTDFLFLDVVPLRERRVGGVYSWGVGGTASLGSA